MITPDEEFIYSKKELRLRAVLVFLIYIFLFFATGTEVIDIANAYFNLEISPRLALLILASLQAWIWAAFAIYDVYRKILVLTNFVALA